MAPFEALPGRRCRTPLNWSETGERLFVDPDSINEAEIQVQLSRDQFSGVLHLHPGRASKGAMPRLARKLLLYENTANG